MEISTDGGIVMGMNTQINPKLVAFAQTLFYGAMFAIIPMVVVALGAGGALSGYFPASVTVVIVFVLNLIENNIQTKTGKAMFGTINA